MMGWGEHRQNRETCVAWEGAERCPWIASQRVALPSTTEPMVLALCHWHAGVLRGTLRAAEGMAERLLASDGDRHRDELALAAYCEARRMDLPPLSPLPPLPQPCEPTMDLLVSTLGPDGPERSR